MKSIINVKDLDYSYDDNGLQLKNINLEIKSGEVVVLIGKSGCGKSSITRVLNGLVPNFYEGKLTGAAVIKGKNLNELKSWEIGKLAGNVFQDPRSQFFANEVAGEIAFGCENYGLSHSEIAKKVNMSAKDMNIHDLLDKSIHTLSYGMRQKVAIASAKAINPDIYIMDEPSANLDIQSTRLLANLIENLKQCGKTVIIAEHRLYYLTHLVDKYLFMKNGEIQREFKPEELLALKNEQLIQLGLRETNLIRLKKRKSIKHSSNLVSLELENVSKKFDEYTILQNISVKCKRGEVIALIGGNGTGKSTLGKILAGLLKESSGNILVNGEKLRFKKRLSKIWYIPQDLDSQLFGEDLIDELLTGVRNKKELIHKATSILSDLGLSEFVDKHPSTLSGGQKQRLALGVALIYDAPIIILDEPTSGLDGSNMRRVANIIKDMSNKGKTIIIITHDVEFALNACNRVLKIKNGSLIEDYPLESASRLLVSMGYVQEKEEKYAVY
ncbi:ABC transporter ATP-binding protein [Clostridium niameyense]|uniref:ABC transporter ATP-binding protein n=1 Tax=Clostridium niameyense TaxID=1622073 RepID=UPI00067F3499|nr:energy-coupling factor ABC transporter ATP-binding protein [Clostridium niameyense]